MAPHDLDRLADRVKTRRLELGIARKKAAELAGMSKDTWRRIEEGAIVREMSYSKVDPVLGWAPGSCKAVLEGREPIPTKPARDAPGADISRHPREDVDAEARDVISLALLATVSGMQAEEIRAFADRAVKDLKSRGLI
ncbi:helix-turn-helix domain-containing protein [Streptomyces sp. NPDC057539]|uniref:helix-turn-helix domain-containing protein n=1 Tax=Streptomyces sp. NPDC057539 TaxID=3346159 RepID=UPI00367F5797